MSKPYIASTCRHPSHAPWLQSLCQHSIFPMTSTPGPSSSHTCGVPSARICTGAASVTACVSSRTRRHAAGPGQQRRRACMTPAAQAAGCRIACVTVSADAACMRTCRELCHLQSLHLGLTAKAGMCNAEPEGSTRWEHYRVRCRPAGFCDSEAYGLSRHSRLFIPLNRSPQATTKETATNPQVLTASLPVQLQARCLTVSSCYLAQQESDIKQQCRASLLQ